MSFSWQQLKKDLKRPIYVLAPMADVTDVAFRRIIAKYGKPDVTWTEFVSADGLIRATPEGKKKLLKDLEYHESERPIIAQLFGSNVENMEKAAKLCKELGFDGIDINMGCPDRSVEKQGAGAAMIKNPERAKEVIRAAQKSGLPVSIKTRIGYNKNELDTWLPAILETKPDLVTIHARTRKEMSLVPADWSQVSRAVEIRNRLSPETLIFGNGDALSVEDARQKAEISGADGVMLGRAIFGTPTLFVTLGHSREKGGDKLDLMIEHTNLFDELLGTTKNFAVMKKHYKAYVNGFDGAKELRDELMQSEDAKEVGEVVKKWKKANIDK